MRDAHFGYDVLAVITVLDTTSDHDGGQCSGPPGMEMVSARRRDPFLYISHFRAVQQGPPRQRWPLPSETHRYVGR